MLTIESIFSPGNTLQINFSIELGSVKTYTVTVIALKEEGLYVATKEIELVNLIELGVEIMIFYEHTDGTKYIFGTYKIEHIVHESPVLILAKPWKVKYNLLRRYFRVDVDLPFYYSLDGNVHIGQIVDLSACGLLALVNQDPRFSIGSDLGFRLVLPSAGEPFPLKGHIARSKSLADNKQELGINFLDLPENVRSEISKYLLQRKCEP